MNAVRLPKGQVNPSREPYSSMILIAPDHIEERTGRLLDKVTAADQNAISGKYLFKAGDIIYSKIRPYLRKAILADFDGLCSADMYPLTAAPGVSPRFMLAVLLGHSFSTFAEAVSARSGIPKINRAELAEYQFPLPPPAEQRAIAAVLSDVDSLIEALEKLITKKRDIKQATMQQLLTGKKRLSGFSGEWEIKTLGELEQSRAIKLFRGKVISQKDIARNPGAYPIYSSSVHANGLFGYYGNYMFDEELITWSVDGGGHFFYRPKHKFSVTNVCGYIRVLFPSLSCRFLAYTLQELHSHKVFDYTMKAHPSVIRGEYSVALPSTAEQKAIAAVLSNMDAEIVALERRLDKTKQIKQGMMQQLLTGRIRLVHPLEAETTP